MSVTIITRFAIFFFYITVGKLSELVVLTSNSPTTNHSIPPQPPSHPLQPSHRENWSLTPSNSLTSGQLTNTPSPLSSSQCNNSSLQALMSAAALTAPVASPLLGGDHTMWDVKTPSPCLPLGMQPLPQQKLEPTAPPTPRRMSTGGCMFK